SDPPARPDSHRTVSPSFLAHDEKIRDLLLTVLTIFPVNFFTSQIRLGLNPCFFRLSAIFSAYSAEGSEIQHTTACNGDSQAGSAPAWFSISMPMKRSKEPRMARCSMTGVRRWSLASTYSAPRRAGMEKSTWMVPHCQWRPMASFSVYSILGP